MHTDRIWGGWAHFVPSLGHGPYGLLAVVLLIAGVAVLIHSIFRK